VTVLRDMSSVGSSIQKQLWECCLYSFYDVSDFVLGKGTKPILFCLLFCDQSR